MAGVAASGLADQGFSVYDPKFSERVRGGWRRVQLFVNYLFLSGLSGRERSVLGTKGVLRLLPGFLPTRFVDDLRSRENEHGVVVVARRERFEPGATVTYRPLSAPVVYLGQSARDRAIVMLSLLGTSREIEVSEAELVAA